AVVLRVVRYGRPRGDGMREPRHRLPRGRPRDDGPRRRDRLPRLRERCRGARRSHRDAGRRYRPALAHRARRRPVGRAAPVAVRGRGDLPRVRVRSPRPRTATGAWPRRSAASTRRSSPARPRTSRPRAATTDPRRRCATLPRTVGVLLEVENLTTEFVTRGGVVRAADDVSWDVGEGETVALVGESGCGKSVSALSIMRLVAPPAGRIVGGRVLFKGRDLLALSDEAMRQIRGREIAMIFQEPM